jgi:hypothetical protein
MASWGQSPSSYPVQLPLVWLLTAMPSTGASPPVGRGPSRHWAIQEGFAKPLRRTLIMKRAHLLRQIEPLTYTLRYHTYRYGCPEKLDAPLSPLLSLLLLRGTEKRS